MPLISLTIGINPEKLLGTEICGEIKILPVTSLIFTRKAPDEAE